MNYRGIIIEESLVNKDILKELKILRKKKVEVTSRHKTPWLTLWTMDTIIIPEENIEELSQKLQNNIDDQHAASWYIDFKNDNYHYIIFRNKVFKVDLQNPTLYGNAEAYGTKLGIPSYQMGFAKLKRKIE